MCFESGRVVWWGETAEGVGGTGGEVEGGGEGEEGAAFGAWGRCGEGRCGGFEEERRDEGEEVVGDGFEGV